jgi:hypothetical protein
MFLALQLATTGMSHNITRGGIHQVRTVGFTSCFLLLFVLILSVRFCRSEASGRGGVEVGRRRGSGA